jgi:hypothetical protein
VEREKGDEKQEPAILTINAGSSSLKFAVFRSNHQTPEPLVKGQIERIGQPGTVLNHTGYTGDVLLTYGHIPAFVDHRNIRMK